MRVSWCTHKVMCKYSCIWWMYYIYIYIYIYATLRHYLSLTKYIRAFHRQNSVIHNSFYIYIYIHIYIEMYPPFYPYPPVPLFYFVYVPRTKLTPHTTYLMPPHSPLHLPLLSLYIYVPILLNHWPPCTVYPYLLLLYIYI